MLVGTTKGGGLEVDGAGTVIAHEGYGLPLLLEALLLLLFGVFGASIGVWEGALVPLTVLIVCETNAPALERRADDPETLHVLEVGKIEEGLARL